jgi:hypothetical protein
MKFVIAGLALLVPLIAGPISLAQAPQGATGRAPEGNLQSGTAMTGAQNQSSGLPNTGTAAQPTQPTHSPRPPGATDAQAHDRPEGNLGSGAAMTGAQRNSAGAAATGGAPPPPVGSSTSSPQTTGAGAPSR